jgi:uncharacterized protein YndB with AHSA1/START domain
MTTYGQNFAKAEMLIRKPVRNVFEAFTNPEITTQFWFTKSTGRLVQNSQVDWTWEMYGHTIPVYVKSVEQDSRIVIEWGEGNGASTVEWTFKDWKGTGTFVSIINSDLNGTPDALIEQVRDFTEGFTLVLAGLKALLEHNIRLNLVGDRFPEGIE